MKPTQRFARFFLSLFGWKVIDLVSRPKKAVVLGYPHTSNWDLVSALFGLMALGFKPRWAGKDSLFKGWRGPIMRKLGGIPVNRSERTGFVDRMVQEFSDNEEFYLVIAPEGTRGLSDGWKSGFYRIALAANVPVIAGVTDYRHKELGFLAAISLTGDETCDMALLADTYKNCEGHTPSRASPVRLSK